VLVVGINAYHGDASAALVIDGVAVAAVEEERFSRQKHQAGFPATAIRWCFEQAGIEQHALGHIAISRNPFAHLPGKLSVALRRRPSLSFLRERTANAAKVTGVKEALAGAIGADAHALRARVHHVEHHRAHLASAFFCSPFEEALAVSLDGMGDFVSTMWARGRGNRLDVNGFIPFPDSLGFYYTAFTQFLGMPQYGDEYKLMGLAAYGEPEFLDRVRDTLRISGGPNFALNLDYFLHHRQSVPMTWASGTPEVGTLYSPHMAEVFGPPRPYHGEVSDRDRALASSVQAHLEEVELEMLRRLHRIAPSDNLVLAGGVALNCVVNGRILEETPFKEVWIQPAANDAGTSLGAALWVWHQELGQPRAWQMTHTYLGPEYGAAACEEALRASGLQYETVAAAELSDRVAGRIAEGAIVGWYQGATEFGPRALGNRSIVCDPRRAGMKDVLNARIKHREPFRPFAPSVLDRATGDWFEQAYPSPFMLMAYKVRPEKRAVIPAVTHEDGTGRLQTVSAETNPAYHALISAFARKTGVPVLLNTSLNENEPIVCRPEEAVDCFNRTEMDVLVLGNHVVDRGTSAAAG